MRLIDADALERMGYVLTRTYQQDKETMVHETKKLSDVPSVQRKTGKWILSDDRDWKTCSECGADVDVSMGLGVFVDNDEVSEMCFCPNCGAGMRGSNT